MRRLLRPVLGAAMAALAVIACTTPATPASAADAPYDVLVFSKTAGFRHDAIPVGIQTIRDLGAANNFTVTATEDAAAFTTSNLAQYEAVVFLNTTGDVLNASQQTAFESYIGSGRGYVGVHAAADTEYDWPFYGNLVGAWFASHPAIQQANMKVEDRGHAATAHLPQTWTRTDEWYNYRTNARSTAHVLATLDESSYSGGGDGRRPPAELVQELQRRPVLLHRRRAHPGVVRGAGVPDAPARRHPVRLRSEQGRLPARDRLHPAVQRLDGRLVTGRAGQLHQLRRHPDLGRRHGAVLVQREAVHQLLAEAGLEAGRGRQLRHLHRLPAVERPVVGGGQRLRDPDRRHRRDRPHHRRRSTPSSPPTSPPATRR